jgi:hypothetical protein
MNELEKYVREQLQGLRLSDNEREDVIAEIAAHLELMADEYRSEGIDADAARRRALAQFGDSRRLLRGIRRTKEKGMNERCRRLWLPALLVGFVAYASQMVIARFIVQHRVIEVFGNYYVYSWTWLFVVAVIGGLGARWSREMGGSPRDRLMVALAPAEIMAAVIAIVLPVGIVVEACVQRQVPYAFRYPSILLVGILWMLHCAVPAFLGAAPFLFGGNTKVREITS